MPNEASLTDAAMLKVSRRDQPSPTTPAQELSDRQSAGREEAWAGTSHVGSKAGACLLQAWPAPPHPTPGWQRGEGLTRLIGDGKEPPASQQSLVWLEQRVQGAAF